MGQPRTSERAVKAARSLVGEHPRLWDCPISGGPFCPSDNANWWEEDLPVCAVCPECGYDTTLCAEG